MSAWTCPTVYGKAALAAGCARSRASGHESEQEHVMRKVIRGYAKDNNLNLIHIATIPVPHSKHKRSPAARQDKRYLVRRGATIFKKETAPIKN
jgi:hypothetical protein